MSSFIKVRFRYGVGGVIIIDFYDTYLVGMEFVIDFYDTYIVGMEFVGFL